MTLEEHFSNLEEPHTGHLKSSHIEVFKDIIDITNARTILELGFNVGHSSIMWLESHPELSIITTDIIVPKKSIDYINETWGERFKFMNLNHSQIFKQFSEGQFDLIFIDGNHSSSVVTTDMENSMKLKPSFILMDDTCHPEHLYLREYARNYGWAEIKHYENYWCQTLYKVGE